jgi:hypothetical protein
VHSAGGEGQQVERGLDGELALSDRQRGSAEASLASSTRFIELDAAAWSNNTDRVMSRNVSGSTFDLGTSTLSAAVTKRRIP